jgi:hypothetical protein
MTLAAKGERTGHALDMNVAIATAEARPLHAESTCEVNARAVAVFDYIDQPERLSAHMARRSWQLAGSSR